MGSLSGIAPLPVSALAQTSDIFWCKNISEDAFLFTLDNAPYVLYETAEDATHTANASFTNPASDALFLLTTPTCYQSPVAEWLSSALATHYRFATPFSMNIHTALHEAIANAVIHGNLGICGRFQDMEGFDDYYARIHARLSHPKYRSARISVAVTRRHSGLTLSVSDEGDGYNDNGFPPGQGLSVIHEQCSAVRVTSGGSIIEMDFTI